MAKNLYDYTVKMDKAGNMSIANEIGLLEKPENPISYVLVGILSCIAITVKPILEKMRIGYDGVTVCGKLYMVDDTVRYSDRIECTLSIDGCEGLDDERKARIADLTKKYCSVSVTISKNPAITLKVI